MTDLDVKQFLEYQEEKKSLAVSYLLWGFLGYFGAHRFYLGETGTAVAMLILTLTVVGILVTFVWWIVDAVLLPGIVKDINRDILDDITDSYRHGVYSDRY
ncbi:MAG: TM2 domain-containing protein [Gammaproteobacteria bacterium]|nr:TM2 domain-containing protein [Gammaproteobacteria bacterium]MXW07508.1 TM2 domain-containing protein [Gammaproteobacteria bacterium]MYC24824.1 TM2 domain-containing protein [Gammaproteobacteria bacterium]